MNKGSLPRTEPISNQGEATLMDESENSYFLSFMFKGKHSNDTDVIGGGRKMTVNNNFSGENLKPSQTFVESGNTQKQAASHNIQLKNNIDG